MGTIEIIKIIIELIVVIGGLTGFISIFLFKEQDKRIKNAEAKVNEATAQNSIVRDYETLLDRYEKTLIDTDKRQEEINGLHSQRYAIFEKKLEMNTQKIKELEKMKPFVCLVEGCQLRKKTR